MDDKNFDSDGCAFCKILRGDLEASFIYRGERCSAFLDIHPITPGHVLIVPNDHAERFANISLGDTGEMFELAQKILIAIQETDLSFEGANLFLSDGVAAGQEIPHSHLHIVPRFEGDGQKPGFSHSDAPQVDRAKLNVVAAMITDCLET